MLNDIDVCTCDCHGDMNVMHCMPCCNECSKCGQNILNHAFKRHQVRCEGTNKKKDWLDVYMEIYIKNE